MELRLDQIVFMIIAAHLLHPKVDLHPYSHSRARKRIIWEQKKN